jgi:hypothetical protein
MKKVCSKCRLSKDLDDDFHRSSARPDGRDVYCKKCRNAINRRNRPKRLSRGARIRGEPWGCDAAAQLADDAAAMAKQRAEDERRDLEVAAILRAQRMTIAGR